MKLCSKFIFSGICVLFQFHLVLAIEFSEDKIEIPRVEIEDLNLHPTVINGELVTHADSFKSYTVKIDVYNGINEIINNSCTGVIVASDMVLTAGHCFSEKTTKVRVGFGLSGNRNFGIYEYSKEFIAKFNEKTFHGFLDLSNASNEKEDELIYKIDTNLQNNFYNEIKQRTTLVNYYDKEKNLNYSLLDFALIKISKLPNNYRPIKLFNGTLKYKQELYNVGYGLNSFFKNKKTDNLRWSSSQLIGFYKNPKKGIHGVQTYSPSNKSACYGDSGGPLVVKVDGVDYLLGILIFVRNKCGNDSWYSLPTYYQNEINSIIEFLRSIKSI